MLLFFKVKCILQNVYTLKHAWYLTHNIALD